MRDAEQIWYGATKGNFDHYELVSCFCPKPYMILGAKSDFFCREGTEKVYAKSQEFYKLFGAQDNMRIAWDDCTHMYSPKMATAAAEFFKSTLVITINNNTQIAIIKCRLFLLLSRLLLYRLLNLLLKKVKQTCLLLLKDLKH